MATTVAQHPLTTFTAPTNGTSPIDADEVRDNDNAVRTAYNAHDADTGIHVQSSVAASRPAAGTSGRKWMSVDQLSVPTQVQLAYDDGSNWYALNYFPSAVTVAAGGIAVTGNSSVTGTLAVSSTINSQTISSAANFTGTLTTAGALTVSANGIAVTGNSTIAGTLGGITALTVAATARSSFNGTLTDYAGVWINQSVTTNTGTGFGSALGFGGTVTAGGDGNAVVGIDMDNMSWATGGFTGTTFYGIRIPSVSGGATNYAIYTNAGAVRFGDALTVNGNVSSNNGNLRLLVSGTMEWDASIATGGSAAAGPAVLYNANDSGRAHTFVDQANAFLGEFSRSSSADDTFLLVFDYTAAQMKRVVRGAADSGGTGYRMLRIPN